MSTCFIGHIEENLDFLHTSRLPLSKIKAFSPVDLAFPVCRGTDPLLYEGRVFLL